MANKFLTAIFGDYSKKEVKRVSKTADKVLALESKYQPMSDKELISQTQILKDRLAAGETLIVDTGNVAGFEIGVSMEIKQVPGLKNKLLGGEGFFNTVLTGPGKVWLQTMPISNVARAISRFIPAKTQ